jgi:general secretion pathway protein N
MIRPRWSYRVIIVPLLSLTAVAVCAGMGVPCAFSQELEPRNELIVGRTASRTSLAEPAALPGPAVPEVGAAAAGTVWPPAALSRANPLWGVPLDSLSAAQDRPVFSASRRPPPAPAAPPVIMHNAGPQGPTLALMGTVAEGSAGIAIFRDEQTKSIIRLQTGQSHLGWTLTAVKPREATMLHAGQHIVLTIPSPTK